MQQNHKIEFILDNNWTS